MSNFPSSLLATPIARPTVVSAGLFGLLFILIFAKPDQALAQQGSLQTIRDDVRNGPPPTPPGTESPAASAAGDVANNVADNIWDPDDVPTSLLITGAIVAAPIWIPMAALGDKLDEDRFFFHYPYEESSDYLTTFHLNAVKPWALRVDADYTNDFDRLDSVGGSLLFETTSRFGFETQAHQLQERLQGGGRDSLWLGDANATFRFAQGNWAEFRAGAGLNWLEDSGQTDLGFNFSYAADIFPCQPWVLSSTIDAGTLGHASLFRFRSTAGVVFRGVEAYTGYEYLDIERTHSNSLIAGIRLWF